MWLFTRGYQTAKTSNACGTGTSLQSSACRELQLLDCWKPRLSVVSVNMCQPGISNFLGVASFGIIWRIMLADGRWDRSPQVAGHCWFIRGWYCTSSMHRQEGDRPAASNGKFFDNAAWITCRVQSTAWNYGNSNANQFFTFESIDLILWANSFPWHLEPRGYRFIGGIIMDLADF